MKRLLSGTVAALNLEAYPGTPANLAGRVSVPFLFTFSEAAERIILALFKLTSGENCRSVEKIP